MTLAEKSLEIDNKLEEKMSEYKATIEVLKKVIADTQERVVNARAQGDLSENAEYKSAVEDLATQNKRLRILAGKVDAYQDYKNMEQSCSQVITLGSVVKLYCPQLIEEFVIKIVPAGVDVPAIGALSENTAVVKRILNEQAGSKVKVLTSSNIYDYQILEVL